MYLQDKNEHPNHLPYIRASLQRFFKQAEISNFTQEEREGYEESLKVYRDLKNVVDTSFMEGEKRGGKRQEKASL